MFAAVVYSHRSHRPGDVAIETVDSSFVTSLLPANKLLGQAAWAKSLGKATSRSLMALAISLRPPRDARQRRERGTLAISPWACNRRSRRVGAAHSTDRPPSFGPLDPQLGGHHLPDQWCTVHLPNCGAQRQNQLEVGRTVPLDHRPLRPPVQSNWA